VRAISEKKFKLINSDLKRSDFWPAGSKCCFVSDSGVLLLKCVPDHNNRINQPVGLAFTMIKGVALAYPDGSFLDTANFKIARLAHNCFYMMHDATIGK